MGQIISIANQKGGVGKSTTSIIAADILANKGFKVLVIDLDAQANTSYAFGALNNDMPTIYDVLKGNNILQAIQDKRGINIIQSSRALSGANMEFNTHGKEYLLKNAIEPIKRKYDYIIIDTSPELNLLNINAFIASTGIIIPTLATTFSMQGLKLLYENIKTVQKINKDLKIIGLLLTRFNKRVIISKDLKEVTEGMAAYMNTKVFNTTIREGVAIQESQTQQQSILTYAPRAAVTKDYINFVNEII